MNTDWQPIETAPKDGTEILLYFRFGHIENGSFVKDRLGYGQWNTFYRTHCSSRWETPYEPSHWMPLPTPPKE